jgi:hypothetical protein
LVTIRDFTPLNTKGMRSSVDVKKAKGRST